MAAKPKLGLKPKRSTKPEKPGKRPEAPPRHNVLPVEVPDGANEAECLAESAMSPTATSALIAMNATCPSQARMEQTGIAAFANVVAAQAKAVTEGDMTGVEAMCAAQMIALNAIFADLAVKSQAHISAGYLEAGETFMRLAFKAQSQCRATAETLGELKNPKPLYTKNFNYAPGTGNQINQTDGPQQINNARTARAGENIDPANKVLAGK